MTKLISHVHMQKGYRIFFVCDYCEKISFEKAYSFYKTKRHFCDKMCFSKFLSECLPKEEQNAFRNGGMPDSERQARNKARYEMTKAIKNRRLIRQPCEVCGELRSEGHHPDYKYPLNIMWLCKRCHWDEHIKINRRLDRDHAISQPQSSWKQSNR